MQIHDCLNCILIRAVVVVQVAVVAVEIPSVLAVVPLGKPTVRATYRAHIDVAINDSRAPFCSIFCNCRKPMLIVPSTRTNLSGLVFVPDTFRWSKAISYRVAPTAYAFLNPR